MLNLNIDQFNKFATNDIYEFRKCINDLYKNNIHLNGDVYTEILSLLETDSNIEKIELNDYNIIITTKDSAANLNVIGEVLSILKRFISNNINQIKLSSDKIGKFRNFINNENMICEKYYIGNQITFSL